MNIIDIINEKPVFENAKKSPILLRIFLLMVQQPFL